MCNRFDILESMKTIVNQVMEFCITVMERLPIKGNGEMAYLMVRGFLMISMEEELKAILLKELTLKFWQINEN